AGLPVLGDKRKACAAAGVKECLAEASDVLCSFVSDIEKEELNVVAEAGDSIGSWELLPVLQNDGMNECNSGWPVSRVLGVGDDLVDVAAMDADRALAHDKLQDLV